MTRFSIAPLLLALASAFGSAAVEIPDRPEKLTFPALNYEAPDPATFRVLPWAPKSGLTARLTVDGARQESAPVAPSRPVAA